MYDRSLCSNDRQGKKEIRSVAKKYAKKASEIEMDVQFQYLYEYSYACAFECGCIYVNAYRARDRNIYQTTIFV